MPDDIEAQLAALEEKAPLTAEPDDEGNDDNVIEHKPYVAPADPEDSKPLVSDAAPDAGADPAKQPAKEVKLDADGKPIPEPDIADAVRKEIDSYKTVAKKEREARRAEQQRTQALNVQFQQQQLELQRMTALLNQLTNPAPDPKVNVVEALEYTQRQLAEQQRAQFQAAQAQHQAAQQNAFIHQLKSTVEDFEAEFTETQPDYPEASDWLVEMEQKRMEELGIPPQLAERGAINTAIQMANTAIANGRNPAEVAWKLAQQQGWQPKRVREAAKGGGAAAANGAPGTIAQQAAAKLQQMRDGQAAAKTMNGGGNGNGGGGAPSLTEILKLNGAAAASAQEKFLDDMIKGRSR